MIIPEHQRVHVNYIYGIDTRSDKGKKFCHEAARGNVLSQIAKIQEQEDSFCDNKGRVDVKKQISVVIQPHNGNKYFVKKVYSCGGKVA